MRLREGAEEMLKAIEDSSAKCNDAYDKLKAGYLRLWKLGALKGFDELRICLFRLILCCFKPLSVDHLTCLLQNRIESLSVRETEILYSNFLVRDHVKQDLVFTHNSARAFVMTEILGKISGGSQKTLASLVVKENHRSILNLFMNYMQRSDYRDPEEMLLAFDSRYFSNFGIEHCERAATKRSIFDEVWSEMIQKVLLPLESRSDNIIFPLTLLRYGDFHSEHRRTKSQIFQVREGKYHLLFSHALVWLHIIHDDDVCDRQLRDLRTPPSDRGTHKGILQHFAERAAMKSTGAEANALHIACLKGNAAAAKLVLKSTYYLYGKDACNDLLSSQSTMFGSTGHTPFVWSLTMDFCLGKDANIPVMETLLWFESRYLDPAGDKEKGHSSQASHKARQWSHVCDGYWNPLAYAVRKFEEETVCRLLKIAGPVAINELDEIRYTPVMCAISWGRLKIMRVLVEDCHADLNVKGLWGKTALDIARNRNQQVAEYLEQRMNICGPDQTVDLSSEVDENTS